MMSIHGNLSLAFINLGRTEPQAADNDIKDRMRDWSSKAQHKSLLVLAVADGDYIEDVRRIEEENLASPYPIFETLFIYQAGSTSSELSGLFPADRKIDWRDLLWAGYEKRKRPPHVRREREDGGPRGGPPRGGPPPRGAPPRGRGPRGAPPRRGGIGGRPGPAQDASESRRRVIDWMEKGVYDALQRKYLKTLMFCICEKIDGPMIEEYAFSFSYSDSDSQDVMMNINRTGNKKHGGTFNSTADITPNQMRSSACKMVRTLVQLMRTLDKMPDERTIVMKLLYYDDVTPPDYEPPFFRGCTDEEAQYVWTKNPLRLEIGNVNSKHLVLTLKVKSVLDPCEDENDDMQDDGKSIGPDSVHDDQPSDSDSEISHTQENQFIVAPVEKEDDDDGEVDEDDTQDPVENEQQLERVKDWINSRHLDTLELTDILANFPDISIVLSEEIMDQLVKEGILSKTGKDTYIKKKDKTPESEFTFVKDEADGQIAPQDEKPIAPEDYLYMKALYHSLPMKYVTITKLHNMLDGEANQTAVRKLMDRMTQEGFVEASSNRRLGKRVIHSSLTEKKLNEVKKVLATDDMDVDVNEAINKTNGLEAKVTADVSTCGGIHSIGSDFTRTKGRSVGMQQNGSVLSEQTISKAGNTPISNKAQLCCKWRESFAVNGGATKEVETVNCSQASQDRRGRKTSMVRELILQYSKRQKSQAN